jgi:hypothetical protein
MTPKEREHLVRDLLRDDMKLLRVKRRVLRTLLALPDDEARVRVLGTRPRAGRGGGPPRPRGLGAAGRRGAGGGAVTTEAPCVNCIIRGVEIARLQAVLDAAQAATWRRRSLAAWRLRIERAAMLAEVDAMRASPS